MVLPFVAAAVLARSAIGTLSDAQGDAFVRQVRSGALDARVAAARALRSASPTQLANPAPELASALADESATVPREALPLLEPFGVAYAAPTFGYAFERPDRERHASAVATLQRLDGAFLKRVRLWLARESSPEARAALEAALATARDREPR